MTHRLFYEGKYFGEVQNPFYTGSFFWFCVCCGRNFALRLGPPEVDPHAGPLRCEIHKGLCGKCFKAHPLWSSQYPALISNFILGGDVPDQLPTLRVQFLYECEVLL